MTPGVDTMNVTVRVMKAFGENGIRPPVILHRPSEGEESPSHGGRRQAG
jgi:hypothetical protein